MGHIEELKKEMKARGVKILTAVVADNHKSEYIADCDNYVKYLTGFTGEGAALIVTQDDALLWVDGRFFIQAPIETEGSGITIMHLKEEGVPSPDEWIIENGFAEANESGGENDVKNDRTSKDSLVASFDNRELINSIWTDRPERPCNEIKELEFEWTGQPAEVKVMRVCEMMNIKGIREATFRRLDDIAWVLNLRGSDIPYNPVFFSYLHIIVNNMSMENEGDLQIDFDATLYVREAALTDKVRELIEKAQIKIRDYDDFANEHGSEDKTGMNMLTGNKVDTDCLIIRDLKTIKSPIELFHIKEANIRDGIYMSKFIAWVKLKLKNGECIDEYEAGKYLDDLRATDEYFMTTSFPTICAYGSNAAIVHYCAKKETAKIIEPRGFLLVDSGATYTDGTTDVTRTIACGPLTEEEKIHYTLVLQGWIRLMYARWKKGEPSTLLDKIARGPLSEKGLDYNHGTGHGIGYVNMVHEGPASISREGVSGNPYVFEGGEIISDEPGVYIEGSHGVRIENMLSCADNDGEMSFENLTMVPIEKSAIVHELLTEEDEENIGKYMMIVQVIVGSYLTEDECSVLFK